ncbi:unnamed protein product [Schistosoma bovis]|nr:unnamed protein product [Schistosoma bovis]CAH8437438.1 unnamed protein product [Schistosoma bovis]
MFPEKNTALPTIYRNLCCLETLINQIVPSQIIIDIDPTVMTRKSVQNQSQSSIIKYSHVDSLFNHSLLPKL